MPRRNEHRSLWPRLLMTVFALGVLIWAPILVRLSFATGVLVAVGVLIAIGWALPRNGLEVSDLYWVLRLPGRRKIPTYTHFVRARVNCPRCWNPTFQRGRAHGSCLMCGGQFSNADAAVPAALPLDSDRRRLVAMMYGGQFSNADAAVPTALPLDSDRQRLVAIYGALKGASPEEVRRLWDSALSMESEIARVEPARPGLAW